MQNIKTIAGTFTIGTYEIPKQYVCAKTPTITQKNDICEIVTYDQQITVNGHNYAPVLHQNCMQPEQITLYPLVIRQEHATLTVSDRCRKCRTHRLKRCHGSIRCLTLLKHAAEGHFHRVWELADL